MSPISCVHIQRKNNLAPRGRHNVQALKGRHNLAQGVNPVYYGISHQKNSSPPRATGARRGGVFLMGLNDRAHALSSVMSPLQGYPPLCRPFRAILRYVALPGLSNQLQDSLHSLKHTLALDEVEI